MRKSSRFPSEEIAKKLRQAAGLGDEPLGVVANPSKPKPKPKSKRKPRAKTKK